MCDRTGFFGKNSHRAKMTKDAQKWSKNKVFGFFKKIATSLFLSGIRVKRNSVLLINILWKLHAWKKSGSWRYSQKWLPSNQVSVFFNRQYFIYRLISDFCFWLVDRHVWKEQDLLTCFLKKFSFGQMGHFGPKNVASHNSGSAERIFFKFCIMKRANR